MSRHIDQQLPLQGKAHLVKVLERRGTHSPRTAAAVTLAILMIVVLVWLGAELVLAALGQPAFLISGEELFNGFFALKDLLAPPLLAIIGGLIAVLGLFILILSLTPGSLRRHRTQTDRFAFIADDKVLSSALSAAVAKQAGVSPDQVATRVSPRRVRVTLTPTSGHSLDHDQLLDFIESTLDQYSLTPAPRASLQIQTEGVVS